MLYLFSALGGFYTNTVSTCGVGEICFGKICFRIVPPMGNRCYWLDDENNTWFLILLHSNLNFCASILVVYISKVYIILNDYNFGQAMKTCLDELMPVTVNGGSTFKKSLTD